MEDQLDLKTGRSAYKYLIFLKDIYSFLISIIFQAGDICVCTWNLLELFSSDAVQAPITQCNIPYSQGRGEYESVLFVQDA